MAIFWMILAQFVYMSFSTGAIVNVALHKTASMSSIHDPIGNRFPAANAVDGNTTTIIHTRVEQTSAWWTVDLGTQVQDALVTIYFRLSVTKRRNGVQFYTSTTPFSSYPGGQSCLNITGRADGTDIPNNVNVTCSGTWSHLMVYSGTTNDARNDRGPILDFGEVTVLGCDRTYGKNCDKLCSSRHCTVSSASCDRYTGACPGGCKTGWKSTDCSDECSSYEYGRNCANSCTSRYCEVSSTTCNRFNGLCSTEGCQAGWKGIDCSTECSRSEYGRNCTNSCSSRHCEVPSTTCNRFNGSCSTEGCQAGWKGIDCTTACPSGKYGVNCMKNCGHCNGSCDAVNGRCPMCLPGYCGTQCQSKLADYASLNSDLDKLTVGVIGAVIGVIVAIVVGAVVHICLLRHGRLQWNKSEYPRQSAEMSDLRNPHGRSRIAGENPQSNTANAYNNDYSVLESTTKLENRVYDVLHDKNEDYQNV